MLYYEGMIKMEMQLIFRSDFFFFFFFFFADLYYIFINDVLMVSIFLFSNIENEK